MIYRDGQLLLIADQFVNEPRKAQIAFYNLTDKPAALKTVDGQHVVVDTIERDQTGSRMVNELKIAFAAYAERLRARPAYIRAKAIDTDLIAAASAAPAEGAPA